MSKPSHYLVVRSPYAEALCLGIKSAEFRSWAHNLAGKRVAIAVAKAPTPKGSIEEELDIWEATPEECAALHKTNRMAPHGKVIGEVQFGEAGECDFPYPGELCVLAASAKLWPRQEWIESKGGLGLRPLK